jgi:hypothetical protein
MYLHTYLRLKNNGYTKDEMKRAAEAAYSLRKRRAITVYKLEKLRAMKAMQRRKHQQSQKRHEQCQQEHCSKAIIMTESAAKGVMINPAQSA